MWLGSTSAVKEFFSVRGFLRGNRIAR